MAKLTVDDKKVIWRLADGDKGARQQAEAIFERCWDDDKDSIEMRYLSEVLNPAPDLLLRGDYRRQVLLQRDRHAAEGSQGQ